MDEVDKYIKSQEKWLAQTEPMINFMGQVFLVGSTLTLIVWGLWLIVTLFTL